MYKILLLLLLLLLFSLPACTTTKEKVIGIDVSHYQDDINWKEVKNTKISFAIVKATEGLDWHDEYFQYNWQLLKEAGLIRGAYHFFSLNSDTQLQLKNYIKNAHLEADDLPPIIDLEFSNKLPPASIIRKKLRTWLRLAENYYKKKPIIYTGKSFYNKYLSGYFPGYPLWIASYSKKTPVLNDKSNWIIWQYTDKGIVSGIDHKVDLNYFNGTIKKMDALCTSITSK